LPRFNYKFIRKSSGRANRATAYAFDEAELRERLALDPQVAEILEVSVAPDIEASEAQLDYLRDLGGSAPHGVTMAEASDLITNAQRKRGPGSEADRALAAHFRLEMTRYASKASIFERIVDSLNDRPEDLARFYVYRVYRDSLGEARHGAITDPAHPPFAQIASELLANDRARRSLLRAASSSSCGFRWFGELRGPDGLSRTGESDRTEAYAVAKAGLIRLGLWPSTSGVASSSRPAAPAAPVRAPRPALEPSVPHRDPLSLPSDPSAQRSAFGLGWPWFLVAGVLLVWFLW
jgi:hypothetical protein